VKHIYEVNHNGFIHIKTVPYPECIYRVLSAGPGYTNIDYGLDINRRLPNGTVIYPYCFIGDKEILEYRRLYR
jgi:hypothetical protein